MSMTRERLEEILQKMPHGDLVRLILAYEHRIEDNPDFEGCDPLDQFVEIDWPHIRNACYCKGMEGPHGHCSNCRCIFEVTGSDSECAAC